jgi:hypothetical protein
LASEITYSHFLPPPLAILNTPNNLERAEMTIQDLIRKGESDIVEFKFGKEIRKNLKVLGYEL